MRIKNILHFKIRILRYHVIIFIVCALLFSSLSMFSSQEKSWFPYTIALTFDDGPHPGYTDQLIRMCNKYNIKVTFFVVGKQADKYPELLKMIDENGHEIANHSYSHSNLTFLTSQAVISELTQTHNAVTRVVNRQPRYFRPPGGNYNAQVVEAALSTGYEMVLWEVAPLDHLQQDSVVIAGKILENASDGDIVLLHSGMDPTIECLPHVIEELKNRGFRFVTVSEALLLRNPVFAAVNH
ncbi:MAG: polysaccharide deacetylase family protein [bacterium]